MKLLKKVQEVNRTELEYEKEHPLVTIAGFHGSVLLDKALDRVIKEDKKNNHYNNDLKGAEK
jgi:hypothetical protein